MKIWKYSDNINTDLLFPGRYTYTCATAEEIVPHLLEDLDTDFARLVQPGDLLMAGDNFGCGSSREQPVLGFKAVGMSVIIARSFARIFYRAGINQGLMLIECAEAVDAWKEGDEVIVSPEEGRISIGANQFEFPVLPREILAIRNAGGLLPFVRLKLSEERDHE